MNDKLVDYAQTLRARVDLLRNGEFETPEERVSCEAIADALEQVVRELTDLIEIR